MSDWTPTADDIRAMLDQQETALREQIAADIEAQRTYADPLIKADYYRNEAYAHAARIAEEGPLE